MINIDQLIYERSQARLNRDFKKSDEIRDILIDNNVFINDHVDWQEVWHMTEDMTREEFDVFMLKNKEAESRFEDWLRVKMKKNE